MVTHKWCAAAEQVEAICANVCVSDRSDKVTAGLCMAQGKVWNWQVAMHSSDIRMCQDTILFLQLNRLLPFFTLNTSRIGGMGQKRHIGD